MSRLPAIFARARAESRRALAIYLTAGDPDASTSGRLFVAAAEAGADILEIGIPWSDPSADGPVIQRAMARARASGGGLRSALEVCRRVRADRPDVGLVLFGYANPLVVMGADRFCAAAKAAGADAVLCVDWPPDEDIELTSALSGHGLDFIPLLAPTSTPDRIEKAAAAAGGFVYFASLTGITGARLGDLEAPRRQVELIRSMTGGRLPVVVGFGISSPEDVRRVGFADGVVVGSGAVERVAAAAAAGQDPVPSLASFVRSLRTGL